jgi:hypothetical protein
LRIVKILASHYGIRKRKIGAGELSGDLKTALISLWCEAVYNVIFSTHQLVWRNPSILRNAYNAKHSKIYKPCSRSVLKKQKNAAQSNFS